MNLHKQSGASFLGGVAVALAALSFTPTVRANVYATNIKLNGSLTGAASVASGGSLTITYILNEAATAGATIKILSGATVVNTVTISSGSAGTLRGLNTLSVGATNSLGAGLSADSYSVGITASATGFSSWTQTSVDGANTAAGFPHGMDVDKNTNSPYYGRVVVGCSIATTAHGVAQKCGFYKANADGSPADEGAFGYAGYTKNDDNTTATGQMSSTGPNLFGNYNANPSVVRIGEDDRIYWADDSYAGAIVACDILAISNQIVITSGPSGPYGASPGNPTNPHNYSTNPDRFLLDQAGTGIQQFDVINANTTNAAIYLADFGDYSNWGVWMFHLTNGAADTNDTAGTQAVAVGTSDDFIVTGAGVMVDYNQDIFISETRSAGNDPLPRTAEYTNWNGGVLPGEGQLFNFSEGTGSPPAGWTAGSGDTNLTAIYDTAINSRSHPTLVALAIADGDTVAGGYSGLNGGISILSAIDGSYVMTNLDFANWYNGVAFDNVGNVYGASRSANYWRVWSPPGANSATTTAVVTANVTVPVSITITSISVSGSTVTVDFTGSASDPASAYTLLGSATVVPASGYAAVPGATIVSLGGGHFQATAATGGSAHFYRIKR